MLYDAEKQPSSSQSFASRRRATNLFYIEDKSLCKLDNYPIPHQTKTRPQAPSLAQPTSSTAPALSHVSFSSFSTASMSPQIFPRALTVSASCISNV